MATDWYTLKEFSNLPKLQKDLETYLKETEPQWAFRGQSCDWPLKTKIELLHEQFGAYKDKLPGYEEKLLREFRRRAHIYYPNPPEKTDTLEWLALLRHHGGPTRLLDFTYSPFIAMYFALEGAELTRDAKITGTKTKVPVVWAVNKTWLRKRAKHVVAKGVKDGSKVFKLFVTERDGESFEKIFWKKDPLLFAMGVVPMQLNERLTLQQGTFICPGDTKASFVDNLKGKTKQKESSQNIHKIVIGKECRKEALTQLRRMNIDRTTLFPGLDGFAQSLNTRFEEIGEYRVAGIRHGTENIE